MVRNIITIDQDKCVGCGLCANACHQGAIGMVDGKATLLRDDYCDGLGVCLPVCPTGAITFEEREAAAYNKAEAPKHKQAAEKAAATGGCPGSRAMALERPAVTEPAQPAPAGAPVSQLRQWPVQIKLVPVNAPYFEGAHLLIAADCTAFAYGDFHNKLMRGKVTIIGCPKLDEGDYSEKLTAILAENAIKSVTIARMEVPCCGGLSNAAIKALKDCGKMIPWQVVTIGTEGEIIED